MCGMSEMLNPNKIYSAIIIKKEFGHMVFIDFTEKEGDFEKIKTNLKITGANIITEVKNVPEEIKKVVLSLNKKAGLPGVMYAPKAA